MEQKDIYIHRLQFKGSSVCNNPRLFSVGFNADKTKRDFMELYKYSIKEKNIKRNQSIVFLGLGNRIW